jgi:hypothetical protein
MEIMKQKAAKKISPSKVMKSFLLFAQAKTLLTSFPERRLQ